MSYHLRTNADGTISLHHYRPATEIGHSGPIGPLPAHLATSVRVWRSLVSEDHGDNWTETVRLGFTVRGHEPVLAMRVNDEPTFTFLYTEGSVITSGRSSESLESHTDQVEWSRTVIGIENLAEGWLRTWAECDPREHSDFVAILAERDDALWAVATRV